MYGQGSLRGLTPQNVSRDLVAEISISKPYDGSGRWDIISPLVQPLSRDPLDRIARRVRPRVMSVLVIVTWNHQTRTEDLDDDSQRQLPKPPWVGQSRLGRDRANPARIDRIVETANQEIFD